MLTQMFLMLVVSFFVTDVRLVIFIHEYRSAFSHRRGTYTARVLNQQHSTLIVKARICASECHSSLGALRLTRMKYFGSTMLAGLEGDVSAQQRETIPKALVHVRHWRRIRCQILGSEVASKIK
jgi:hypothetical protein